MVLRSAIFLFIFLSKISAVKAEVCNPLAFLQQSFPTLKEDGLLDARALLADVIEYELLEAPLTADSKKQLINSTINRNMPIGDYWQDRWEHRLTESRIQEHEQYLDEYYKILRSQRGFSEERIKLFQTVEKAVPLYRQKLYIIKHPLTGEYLGTVRTVNASKKVSIYGKSRAKYYGELGSQIEDGDFLSPYERSLKLRGAQSEELQKLRDEFPAAKLMELGRAFKKPNSHEGDIAKAVWELLLSLKGRTKLFDDVRFIIHTDRAGATVFARSYGAEVKELVVPHSDHGTVSVIAQNRIEKSDPTDAEYLLLVNANTFREKVINSFATDGTKVKILDEVPALASTLDRVRSYHEVYENGMKRVRKK